MALIGALGLGVGGVVPARAQGVPAGVPADTLVVSAAGDGAAGGFAEAVTLPRAMEAGDRVVVWTDNRLTVEDVAPVRRSVRDAPADAVVARFAGGPAFAWPERAFVWTAPSPGRLAFTVNTASGPPPSGTARLVAVPLRPDTRAAFPEPSVTLARGEGGMVVGYADRAGFGLDRKTVAVTIAAADGRRIRLAAWAPAGPSRAILPLPPPLDLPPGIHSLTAEITDRLGNVGRSKSLRFHTR